MAANKPPRGLGSGLGDILGISYGWEEETHEDKISEVRLAQIEPNRSQPRKLFDDESLAVLAESIRENGVITPIALRKLGEARYVIIAGAASVRPSSPDFPRSPPSSLTPTTKRPPSWL